MICERLFAPKKKAHFDCAQKSGRQNSVIKGNSDAWGIQGLVSFCTVSR
jgi:hypothetical protein